MSDAPENSTGSEFNLGTVIDDAKRVITNPVEFFRTMPTSGGYANPLIFVAVIAAITGVIGAVLGLMGMSAGMGMTGAAAFGAIIFYPIMAVIGSFIGAAILFVIWKLMGSEKDYEVAYRCVAYAWAIAPIVMVIAFIPYVGTIVRALWGMFLMYTASVEVHKLKEQTAKIVFGVLAALGLLFGISSEHTARNLEDRWNQATRDSDFPNVFKGLEDAEEMTPEEAGKQVGEFWKGLQEAAKEKEEAKNNQD